MSLVALLLIIVAAVLHTGWNFMVKQVTDKHVFTCRALVVGTLAYLPLLLQGWLIPAGIWPYAIVSALLEVAYFIALIHAYDRGDFSLVYPSHAVLRRRSWPFGGMLIIALAGA